MSLTLADVKKYLRYDASDTEPDDPLGIIIAGAQNWVERHTGKAFSEYPTEADIPAVMLNAVCLIAAMTDEERGGGGPGWQTVEWLLADYHKPALA